MADKPFAVCIFSGKRKSGKDFIAARLKELLGAENCEILRLSGPLKGEYARIHGLDFDKLLDSSSYKEIYRKDMIKWGEEKRNAEPFYFCELAAKTTYREVVPNQFLTKPYWIISDARRKTDVKYFLENCSRVVHVRVAADDDVRRCRGWTFTSGVDDAESECGLDDATYDVIITNNGNEEELRDTLSALRNKVIGACS